MWQRAAWIVMKWTVGTRVVCWRVVMPHYTVAYCLLVFYIVIQEYFKSSADALYLLSVNLNWREAKEWCKSNCYAGRKYKESNKVSQFLIIAAYVSVLNVAFYSTTVTIKWPTTFNTSIIILHERCICNNDADSNNNNNYYISQWTYIGLYHHGEAGWPNSSLIKTQASQLHRKNGFREKLYLDQLVLVLMAQSSGGREGLEQTIGWVRWATYDFACSTTQPSAVQASDGWKYVTYNTGDLPNYTFQVIYNINGRSANKPDSDTKLKTLSITER